MENSTDAIRQQDYDHVSAEPLIRRRRSAGGQTTCVTQRRWVGQAHSLDGRDPQPGSRAPALGYKLRRRGTISTLLTFQFKDNTPETDIVVRMLHRTDPARCRARHGFSLLDMKRFALARGYTAEGFSDMSIQELADQQSAVIVPIRLKGLTILSLSKVLRTAGVCR